MSNKKKNNSILVLTIILVLVVLVIFGFFGVMFVSNKHPINPQEEAQVLQSLSVASSSRQTLILTPEQKKALDSLTAN